MEGKKEGIQAGRGSKIGLGRSDCLWGPPHIPEGQEVTAMASRERKAVRKGGEKVKSAELELEREVWTTNGARRIHSNIPERKNEGRKTSKRS